MVRQNKHRIISGVIAMLFLFCGSAWATAAISTGTDVAFFGDNNVQFTPVPDNLYDLSHDSAYTWGINYQLPQGQYVDTASITFTNINNWKDEPNVLYVNLLDSAPYGVSVANDNEAAGNFFASVTGAHELFQYHDDDASAETTYTYTFNPGQLAALNSALADANFGIGFDLTAIITITELK